MEKKVLVKPQMEEYTNFEVYSSEGSSDPLDTASKVATIVGACAALAQALWTIFGC